MTVDGKIYTDKKEAGTAFLESCRRLKANQEEKPVGNYKGFDLSVTFNKFTQLYNVILKNNISHTVELGADIFGNITRIDNALNNIQKKLDSAKEEVNKPFERLSELREKEARLKKLNIELSMENKEVSDENKEKPNDLKKEKKNNDIEL